MAHLLEVGIPNALGFIIGMADIVTDMRRFAAKCTYSAHESGFLSHQGWNAPFNQLKRFFIAERLSNNKHNVWRTLTEFRVSAIPGLGPSPG